MANPETGLTYSRQVFCQECATNGHNASKAYKVAYPNCKGGWDKLGSRLMGKDGIKEEIARLTAEVQAESIATKQQRQAFWTQTYKDTKVNMGDRLRSSELLGKSEADFTEVIKKADDDVPELTEDELQRLKEQARGLVKPAIKLVKGAKEAG